MIRTKPMPSTAAIQFVGNVTKAQARIRGVIADDASGRTDEEIYIAYGRAWGYYAISPSGCRTRRKELVEQGRVQNSGRTRPLKSGRTAIVWEAV